MRHAVSVFAAAALTLTPAAFAADTAAPADTTVAARSDSKPSPRSQTEALRPSGPVTVKADRAEWVQDSQMKYVGNVSMSSDTLVVRGDSMEVRQAADGQFEAWVHGKPATLDHAADPDASGLAAKPLHAEAREIHYDSKSGTADMSGGAHIKRGSDEVDGDTIGYVVSERRIRAASGGMGQVTITFQPPPAKKQDAPSGKNNKGKSP